MECIGGAAQLSSLQRNQSKGEDFCEGEAKVTKPRALAKAVEFTSALAILAWSQPSKSLSSEPMRFPGVSFFGYPKMLQALRLLL